MSVRLSGAALALVACATGRPPSPPPTLPLSWTAPAVAADDQAALEARLADRATLDELVTLALARDPAGALVAARVAAARERGRAEAALPPPEVELELRGVPLTAPWDVTAIESTMVSVRQRFPAAGLRAARRVVGEREAAAVALARPVQILALRYELAMVFCDYRAAVAEGEALAAQLAVTDALIATTTRLVGTGAASAAEVVAMQRERETMAADVTALAQAAAVARTRLDVLAGRAPDAPLGPPAPFEHAAVHDEAALYAALPRTVPEIAMARAELARAEAEADAARLEARRPAIAVGLGAMVMAPGAHDTGGTDLAAAASVAVELPGAWGGPGAAARAAAREREAAAAAVMVAERAARIELAGALAGLRAAEAQRARLAGVVPAAERALTVATAALGAPGGSVTAVQAALRALTDARRALVAADAEVWRAGAALDRAVGLPVEEVTP